MKRKDKTLYNKDGEIIGYSSKVRLIDKYWHRIKFYFKKEHDRWCQCYWCLKERFTTDITCPECKKRKLKVRGWHINYGFNKPHETGTAYYCKCGYDSHKAPKLPYVSGTLEGKPTQKLGCTKILTPQECKKASEAQNG